MSSLKVYKDVEQRSDQWFDLRRGMVTASTISVLLTPSLKVADNDKSRGAVAALVAERITGVSEPSFVNDDMMRGILEEPLARDKYAETRKVTVTEVGFMVRDFDGRQLGYSPDGLVGDDGLIEVKCPRAKGHLLTVLADEVPAAYMAQCQTALLVSGRKWLDYISWHAGLPFYVKRVLPDPAWHAAIREALHNFEESAARMAADFAARTENLPATERVDMEVVI